MIQEEKKQRIQRKKIHERKLDINCYIREDDLFDIEAKIIDKKPFITITNYDFNREANKPIHEMILTVTINKDFNITDVEALMRTPAHYSCHPASEKYRDLIGIRIGPGWIREVKEKIPMNRGCTHLTEMLQQIGTTAFQGVFGLNLASNNDNESTKSFSSNFTDTCYGLRKDGFLYNKNKK
ncbi:MAG: hypothetical protein CFH01_00812 [Alphaproteobacteria bacterium MarineAlpha2_Bin1]|nr:MAG: hypothetical protein CFH01_00812 [Alphaproteobacteria bacterium MarineAlpha2_Bin1]|tara:strand:+ start:280 stop:825 length:546 start_codon:yes stop_codon:yes gene_type:complete